MYAWKCWRETRWLFFGYLAGLLACGFGTVLFRILRYRDPNLGWAVKWNWTPEAALGVWLETIGGLAGGGWIVIIFAGLTLGAATVGDEFQQKTLEFLLTRPRGRRYFIWTNWLVGVFEVLAMCVAAGATTMLLLLLATRTLATWKIWAILPILFVTATVFFSLTYFLTTVVRSGREGSAYALATVLVYAAASLALERYGMKTLPAISNLLVAALKPEEVYPLGALAGWMVVALAFPLVSQWIFERAEI